MLGCQGVELTMKMIGRYGLVGGGMPLRVGFEISKAHARPSSLSGGRRIRDVAHGTMSVVMLLQ